MYAQHGQWVGVQSKCSGRPGGRYGLFLAQLAAAVVLLGFIAAAVRATDKPDPLRNGQPTDSPRDEEAGSWTLKENRDDGPSPAGIDTLVRLRRLLGNPFAGTCFESDSGDQEFRNALERTIRQGGSCFERTVRQGGGCETSNRGVSNPHGSQIAKWLAGGTAETFPSVDSRESIRRVARQLDQLAADLEDIDRYGDADELRQVASRLRQSVRYADRAAETSAAEAAVSALRHALRQE